METTTICPTSVETILACKRIAKAFKENIYELSSVRKDWDVQYANSLNNWVNDIIERDYLGNLENMDKEEFGNWHEIMVAGLQNLKILRACLKVDFKDDKTFMKETFKKLGYTEFYSDAKSGDHRSLFRLLTQFSENLTDEIRKQITSKKTKDSLFVKILESANGIQQFKCCFEALESDAILNIYEQKEVLEIYQTIQDICEIALAYFDFDPSKRNQFNFYKVIVNI